MSLMKSSLVKLDSKIIYTQIFQIIYTQIFHSSQSEAIVIGIEREIEKSVLEYLRNYPRKHLRCILFSEVAASQPDKPRNFTEEGLHRGCLRANIGEIPLTSFCRTPAHCGVPKISQTWPGKNLCRSLLFHKVAGFSPTILLKGDSGIRYRYVL